MREEGRGYERGFWGFGFRFCGGAEVVDIPKPQKYVN